MTTTSTTNNNTVSNNSNEQILVRDNKLMSFFFVSYSVNIHILDEYHDIFDDNSIILFPLEKHLSPLTLTIVSCYNLYK